MVAVDLLTHWRCPGRTMTLRLGMEPSPSDRKSPALLFSEYCWTEDRLTVKARESYKPAVKLECSECRTSETPQWRNGPNGLRTLCNKYVLRYSLIIPYAFHSDAACGIRKTKIGSRPCRSACLSVRYCATAEKNPPLIARRFFREIGGRPSLNAKPIQQDQAKLRFELYLLLYHPVHE